jgi:hypothetical protein
VRLTEEGIGRSSEYSDTPALRSLDDGFGSYIVSARPGAIYRWLYRRRIRDLGDRVRYHGVGPVGLEEISCQFFSPN